MHTNNEEKTEIKEYESSDFFWESEEVKRTGISCKDWENMTEIAALCGLLARRFGHGAGLSGNNSSRKLKKYFLGEPENDLINMGIDIPEVKVALADILVAEDGAGAVVNGKISHVGCWITMSKRACVKALKVLNNQPSSEEGKRKCYPKRKGSHTRHGSMTAYSVKCPHTIDFVISHRGRACILVKGKVVGQITSIGGLEGPVYIRPYGGRGFPVGDEEHLVTTNSAKIQGIIKKGFKSGDIYVEYVVKAQANLRWQKQLGMKYYISKLDQDKQKSIQEPNVSPVSMSGIKAVIQNLITNDEDLEEPSGHIKVHEIKGDIHPYQEPVKIRIPKNQTRFERFSNLFNTKRKKMIKKKLIK